MILGRSLALCLSVGTFLLLLLGGVVHSTGSSLACPDWPLCFGQVFVEMKGGILYEHGHRLLASAMGFLSLALCACVFAQPAWRALRPAAVCGVLLVILQGTLGGLTVLWRLPPLVSVAHLGCAMAFFSGTLAMNVWLRQTAGPPVPQWAEARRAIAATAALVWLQLVTGAAVRHQGASMSCAYDVLGCAGEILPHSGLQWLQTAHRLLALGVLAAIAYSTRQSLRVARSSGRRDLRGLSLAAHVLLLAQIVLGILVIKTAVHMHVVTTHLGLGALLLGDLVVLRCLLRR